MPPAIVQPPTEPAPSGASRPFIGLIWGVCLLLIAAIWWFVIAQTQFEHRQAVDDGVRQNINRSIAFEQYVRRTLEAADLVTRYVGSRFARGAAGGEFAGAPGRPALITGSVARTPTFLSINVIDAGGNIVATSVTRPLPRYDIADNPNFQAHVRSNDGGLRVSHPVFSPLAGQNVLWLTRRLNRPDGSFAGVIAVNILPAQFVAFYRDARVNRTDVMSVIGLDGIIRARRTEGVTQSGQDVRGRGLMAQQREDPNGTHLGASIFDGQTRYFSHRRLADYGLFVAYGVLETDILAPSRARARVFIVAAVLASLLLLAIAAFLTFHFRSRDRRESEMARANRRLEEAQRIAGMGDWRFDAQTRQTHWSPQMYVLHERDPDLGPIPVREYRALLDDEGRSAIDAAVTDVLQRGEPQQFELTLNLPSGATAHHQVVGIPLKNEAGQVVGLRGTSQDVRARILLDQLQTQVAHLSRVEAMNAMAATLAHELNQPLTAASNYLAGSRRMLKGGTPGEVEEGMAAAEQQVHLAADIIRRVREMVSNQPKTVTSVSLQRVIDDAAALIAVPRIYPKLILRRRLADDAVSVTGDRIQVQQVLINLIRNAGDATAGRPDPRITISSRLDEAGNVLVCVADNGPGFSQPSDDRFSPFASTKSGGLGLGLSISRTIVEAHGGRIWIEDGKSDGASVCFTLPAGEAGAEPPKEAG